MAAGGENARRLSCGQQLLFRVLGEIQALATLATLACSPPARIRSARFRLFSSLAFATSPESAAILPQPSSH
ncbi:hypothetical protein [Pantoea sp. B65]|uniref:hypothetical protein n=1 Tax=Pantoea sp. B65 TaxID=2813359 RepID=UPI0039B64135